MPAIVRPKGALKRGRHCRPPGKAHRMNHSTAGREVRALPHSGRKGNRQRQPKHGRHFRDREKILYHPAKTHTQVIDDREHQDHRRGQSLHP